MKISTKEAWELFQEGLAVITKFNMDKETVTLQCIHTGHTYWCYMDSRFKQTWQVYSD